MYIYTDETKNLIREKGRELAEKYPIEANYNSRQSLWSCGLRDGLVSEELYRTAQNYYGRLWDYVGD
jgi:hypothetical protein